MRRQRTISDLTLCELIDEGPEFTLWRARRPDGLPVFAQTLAGKHVDPVLQERLEHAFSLREICASCGAVVPLALEFIDGRPLLVLADPGGEFLEHLILPETNTSGIVLDATRFFDIAIPLTEALGRLHAMGWIHKDIKPSNVIVDTANHTAHLTGFFFTARTERRRQAPEAVQSIAGSLPYIAPEQTGRMNRSVDARSDLEVG